MITKLYGSSTCGCNNNTIFQKELFSCFLTSTYARHVGLTADKPWRCMPKLQDGNTDEFIFLCLKFRFCVTTVSNIVIIV